MVLVGAGCLSPGRGSAHAAGGGAARAHTDATAPGVSVQGPHLLLDGAPWVPLGTQIVGLVAPQGSLQGKYVAAGAHFGAGELRAAVSSGARVVRFQVSQFGLDPQGPLYSPAYVREVQAAVQTARALGLEVIVSLQAEPPAGEPTRCPLPDAGAERVWNEVAAMFADDHGVMFELYNEPAVAATPSGWQKWLYGGPVIYARGSCEAVGMQSLIDDIRSDGADNVIVVPGLAGEQTLAGMPPPLDPANPQDPQLAYGVHYPSMTRGSVSWDHRFGDTSAGLPVIVTEWDANSTTGCVSDAPGEAQLLVDYLASKQIGIVGFAFDLPGTIIADWSYAPTTYRGFVCGVPGGGPGQLLFDAFAAETGDSRAWLPNPPPAWILPAAVLRRLAARRITGAFDNPRTFITGAGRSLLDRLSVPQAVPTASFTDERRLAAAIRADTLPAGTKAVLYDQEGSSLTPRAQQRHPARYYQQAAEVAHSHGLLLIASPATGLVSTLAPRARSRQQNAEFLRLRIPAAAARYADSYEIRPQDNKMNAATYASFVLTAAAQATAAHPGVEVLAELRTHVRAGKTSAAALLNGALATWSRVSGYVIAGPNPGKACQICTGRETTLARSLLGELQAHRG